MLISRPVMESKFSKDGQKFVKWKDISVPINSLHSRASFGLLHPIGRKNDRGFGRVNNIDFIMQSKKLELFSFN